MSAVRLIRSSQYISLCGGQFCPPHPRSIRGIRAPSLDISIFAPTFFIFISCVIDCLCRSYSSECPPYRLSSPNTRARRVGLRYKKAGDLSTGFCKHLLAAQIIILSADLICDLSISQPSNTNSDFFQHA